MKATCCPECLSRDGLVFAVFEGEACRRCGVVPTVKLSPREIRACLKARTP